jgi:hypothetical protein
MTISTKYCEVSSWISTNFLPFQRGNRNEVMSFDVLTLLNSRVDGTEIESTGLTDVAVDFFHLCRERWAALNSLV